MAGEGAADELRAGALASYRWGEYRIHISRLARFPPGYPVKILASVGQGVAPWSSPAEFRATVAILHECIHYEQDIATGLGHWDWLARRRLLPDLFAEARFRSWMDGASIPMTGEPRRRMLLRHAESSRYEFSAISRQTETDAILEVASQMEGFEPGLEEIFRLRSLLELEAVLSVMLILLELRSSDEQYAIQTDNRSLWRPDLMDRLYRDAFMFVLQPLVSTLMSSRGAASVKVAARIALYLLDIALNVPPPDEDTDHGRYRPGLRFLHSLRELFQGDRDLTPRENLYRSLDGHLVEADGCRFRSSADITRDWIEMLRSQEDERSLPIAQWRIRNCERRLQPDYQGPHSLSWVLAENSLHFDFPESRGSSPIVFAGPQLVDEDLYAAILNDSRDIGLRDLMLARSRKGFHCPYCSHCSARQQRCLEPYASLLDLPDLEGCHIRSMLKQWGWNFMYDIETDWTEFEPVLSQAREALEKSEDLGEDSLTIGFGAVLLTLALQVAVPIVTSFVSSVLFEKYKSVATRADAKKAKEEMERTAPGEPAPAAAVIQAVTATLVGNGFGGGEAERLATKLYAEAKAGRQAN